MFKTTDLLTALDRRRFLQSTGTSLGSMALATLLNRETSGAEKRVGGLPTLPHFPARAKRVIYLCQSGAPSQLDLYDYKPGLQKRAGQELPDSIRQGQRLTGMTADQPSFPTAPSLFKFAQHGQSGAWLSELLPRPSITIQRLRSCKPDTSWRDGPAWDPGSRMDWVLRTKICPRSWP